MGRAYPTGRSLVLVMLMGAEPKSSASRSRGFGKCCRSWPFLSHLPCLVHGRALSSCQWLTPHGPDSRNSRGWRFPSRGGMQRNWVGRESFWQLSVVSRWEKEITWQSPDKVCATLNQPVNPWTQFSHIWRHWVVPHTRDVLWFWTTASRSHGGECHLITAADRLCGACPSFPFMLAAQALRWIGHSTDKSLRNGNSSDWPEAMPCHPNGEKTGPHKYA